MGVKIASLPNIYDLARKTVDRSALNAAVDPENGCRITRVGRATCIGFKPRNPGLLSSLF